MYVGLNTVLQAPKNSWYQQLVLQGFRSLLPFGIVSWSHWAFTLAMRLVFNSKPFIKCSSCSKSLCDNIAHVLRAYLRISHTIQHCQTLSNSVEPTASAQDFAELPDAPCPQETLVPLPMAFPIWNLDLKDGNKAAEEWKSAVSWVLTCFFTAKITHNCQETLLMNCPIRPAYIDEDAASVWNKCLDVEPHIGLCATLCAKSIWYTMIHPSSLCTHTSSMELRSLESRCEF